MDEWTGGQKLAVVGAGVAVMIGVTVLAHVVSRCRRAYGYWSAAKAKHDHKSAEVIRLDAAAQGCDWPSKVA